MHLVQPRFSHNIPKLIPLVFVLGTKEIFTKQYLASIWDSPLLPIYPGLEKRSRFEKRARTLSDGQKGPGRNRIGRENTLFGRENTLLGRFSQFPGFHH